MKSFKRFLSVFLVVLMVVGSVPVLFSTKAEALSAQIPPDAVEYNGHAYAFIKISIGVSRQEKYLWAEEYCESLGGHLATLTSREENNFVYDAMKSKGISDAHFGLSDYEKKNDYRWITGEPYEFSSWSPGEPNHEGGVEHWGMFYNRSPKYTWNDGCFGDTGHFICEWDEVEAHQWYFDSDNTAVACRHCSETLPLAAQSGFKYGRDNFSFKHSEISNYNISVIGQSHVNPLLKLDIFSYIYNIVQMGLNYKDNKEKNRLQYGAWGGSCYGMAAMAAQFKNNLNTNLYGSDTVYGLSIKNASLIGLNYDTKLKDSINIMYFSQTFTPKAIRNEHLNFKKIVETAKNDVSYSSIPVLRYHKYQDHAVNIIGILPDDYDEDYYVISLYDCNEEEPQFICVTKDYKKAFISHIQISENDNSFEFVLDGDIGYNYSIHLISRANDGIDFWAPYLTIEPSYGLFNRAKSARLSTALNDNLPISENTDYSESQDENESYNYLDNYVRFILASDSIITIIGDDGTYFKYNEKIIDSNINNIYCEEINDFGTTSVFIPYTTSTYNIVCDSQYYVNIGYNGKISTIYCEKGGLSTYNCSGKVSVNTTQSNSYYELSSYKFDILKNTNVIGVNLSDSNAITSIDFSNDNAVIESNNLANTDIYVIHNDETFSVENIEDYNECSNKIELNYANDNIVTTEIETNHSLSLIQKTNATCLDSGYSIYKCSICGATSKEAIAPPTGHTDSNHDGKCDTCGASTGTNTPTQKCSCNCHKSGFIGFIWKIQNFFNKIFKKNQYCACGAKHW